MILHRPHTQKERMMIQNISQLFDILMDAVDEINSHFSIQVFSFQILKAFLI